MKKIFPTMLAFCVVALLVLGGCAGQEMTDTQTPAPETAKSDVVVEPVKAPETTKPKPKGPDESEITPPEPGEGVGGNGDAAGTLKTINFEFDKSRITAKAKATLDENYDYLVKFGTVKVLLVGHCDERGSDEYNLALGERRSDAAKDYLVNRGIKEDRIEIMSKGENEPIDSGHNEEAWAKNRRAEFILK